MDRAALIEGVLLIIIGLVGISEGYRLSINRDPSAVQDMMGTGSYVLFVSIALMITGAAYLIVQYKKRQAVQKGAVDQEMRKKMILTVLVLAGYLIFIQIFGYLVSTGLFFFLEFRIAGIKSWRNNVVLTIILTVIYYIVFVQYCNMTFPRGILFT
jgi:putative tricarboxylic transport membrane protein